jgi:NitT/TauT family transport system substrate-binding protein
MRHSSFISHAASLRLRANRAKSILPAWARRWRSPNGILGLILIGLISLLVSCAATPPRPLRVAVNSWPGYETLYLAKNLGHYDNTPIQLVDFASGTEEVRAYQNGSVEAAALSLDQVLVLATTHPDVRIVTVMDFSHGGDVILAKPKFSTLAALKGKRIGVEANALGAYIITRALQQAKMSPKDVEIVSLGVSEHERAFKTGRVDAVVTFGPARTRLLAKGAKQLFDSTQIPGEIVDVLVMREAVLSEPAAIALVQGRFRALATLVQDPLASAKRMAPRTKVTPAQLLESLQGLRSPDLQENQKLLSAQAPLLFSTTRQLMDVMVENKLLSKPVDIARLFDDRLVKAVKL